MVSVKSFKSSSIQNDVYFVNDGPFRVKQTIKQSTLLGGDIVIDRSLPLPEACTSLHHTKYGNIRSNIRLQTNRRRLLLIYSLWILSTDDSYFEMETGSAGLKKSIRAFFMPWCLFITLSTRIDIETEAMLLVGFQYNVKKITFSVYFYCDLEKSGRRHEAELHLRHTLT